MAPQGQPLPLSPSVLLNSSSSGSDGNCVDDRSISRKHEDDIPENGGEQGVAQGGSGGGGGGSGSGSGADEDGDEEGEGEGEGEGVGVGVGDDEEYLQELARKLPEGDALPDGFSDCPTEIQSSNSKQHHHRHHHPAQIASPPSPSPSPSTPPLRPPPDPSAASASGSNEVPSLSSSNHGGVSSADLNNEIALHHSSLSSSSSSSSLSAARNVNRRVSINNTEAEVEGEEVGVEVEEEAKVKVEEEEVLTEGAENVFRNPNDQMMPATSEETRAIHKKRGSRNHHGFDTTEDDSEIDELISGTALAENGDQTLEGLHSSLLEDEIQDLRKQNELLMNEKLAINAHLTKTLVLREKLESLCRELQRQNKQLSDECKRIASEEKQKRLDLSTKFHDAIKDVTAKLEEQGEERIQQIKENELLQQKLIQFTQQYEVKEQHYAHQLKTKALEHNLLEVKLKQQEELNKQAEAKVQHYAEQMTELLKTEQNLRAQLTLYGDKFEQFQETLTKSNEVFSSFKAEMEKMSKTIKKLEKENLALQKKCEKSDVTLIELVDERATLKKQLEVTRNQKEKLETLCRTLQTERKQQKLALSNSASSASESGADAVTPPLQVMQVDQEKL